MGERVCVFCLRKITPNNDSREHIIPDCIGGKLQVPSLVCRDCNSYLGRECDAELCDFLSWIAYAEGLKGEKKSKSLKGIGSDGREYRVIFPGFKPVLHRPYVKYRELEDGKTLLEIQAPDVKTLRRTIKNILRKILGREPTDEEINGLIEQGKVINRRGQDLWINFSRKLDLRKLYRAVSKIAYQYLCYRLFLNYESNLHLLKGLRAIREFILGSNIPNYFCSLLPQMSLVEINYPHIVCLFSYNSLAMAYVKLFSFEFLVNLQAYWNFRDSLIEVTPRPGESPCLSFRIKPNWGNMFPCPYALKWKISREKVIPDINPPWLSYWKDYFN